MVRPGKIFKIEVLKRLENAILNLVSANNRGNFVNLLNRIYRKCVKYSFVS